MYWRQAGKEMRNAAWRCVPRLKSASNGYWWVCWQSATGQFMQNDGRFVWTKGCQQSQILSATEWAQLPAPIIVRIIRLTATIGGFRSRRITLVTTLLDPKLYPAQQLVALYVRRWRLELCLRALKTTMGMEQLRCKTPDMADKELLAYLVAHNLIRCVIAEAVARFQVDLERVSFKGSVDALRQYSDAIAKARNQKMRR